MDHMILSVPVKTLKWEPPGSEDSHTFYVFRKNLKSFRARKYTNSSRQIVSIYSLLTNPNLWKMCKNADTIIPFPFINFICVSHSKTRGECGTLLGNTSNHLQIHSVIFLIRSCRSEDREEWMSEGYQTPSDCPCPAHRGRCFQKLLLECPGTFSGILAEYQ